MISNTNKIFCAGCGQRLVIVSGIVAKIKGITNPYEFADGYYCEGCAVAKVEKARKNQKLVVKK